MLRKNSLSGVLLVIALLFMQGASAQNIDTSIVGIWQQKGDNVFIEIYEQNGLMNARIIRNDWQPTFVGLSLFQGLKLSGKKRWSGQAFLPKTQALARLTLSLSKKDLLTSKVRGAKTIQWSRVNINIDDLDLDELKKG